MPFRTKTRLRGFLEHVSGGCRDRFGTKVHNAGMLDARHFVPKLVVGASAKAPGKSDGQYQTPGLHTVLRSVYLADARRCRSLRYHSRESATQIWQHRLLDNSITQA